MSQGTANSGLHYNFTVRTLSSLLREPHDRGIVWLQVCTVHVYNYKQALVAGHPDSSIRGLSCLTNHLHQEIPLILLLEIHGGELERITEPLWHTA